MEFGLGFEKINLLGHKYRFKLAMTVGLLTLVVWRFKPLFKVPVCGYIQIYQALMTVNRLSRGCGKLELGLARGFGFSIFVCFYGVGRVLRTVTFRRISH